MGFKRIHISGKLAIVVSILIMGTSVKMVETMKNVHASQGNNKSVSLVVSTEKSTFSAGQAIVLDLSLGNSTGHVVYYSHSTPEKDYNLDIRKKNGEPVRLTKYGELLKIQRGNDFRRIMKSLNSGEQAIHQITISRIFDLSTKGTYLITARRNIFKQKNSVQTEIVS